MRSCTEELPEAEKGSPRGDILFFLAVILAGAINSMAGGGGLITFPLLALVISPVAADATSGLGLVLAYPPAVWRTRDEIAQIPRVWL